MILRTREKGYKDYGFEDGEEQHIKEYCRRDDFSDHDLLLKSAISANPCIANDLYYSVVKGLSYEAIDRMRSIPISKADFYGYRRKCLAIFRNWLLFYGKLDVICGKT